MLKIVAGATMAAALLGSAPAFAGEPNLVPCETLTVTPSGPKITWPLCDQAKMQAQAQAELDQYRADLLRKITENKERARAAAGVSPAMGACLDQLSSAYRQQYSGEFYEFCLRATGR